MVAVDTNLLVRLLTGDDPEQAGIVRMLMAAGDIWIAKTVLLETGWVLNSLYDFDEIEICNAFEKLLGLPNVQVENEGQISLALKLAKEHRLEWADALHVASCPAGLSFTTFDKPLVNRAQRAGLSNVTGLVGSAKKAPTEK